MASIVAPSGSSSSSRSSFSVGVRDLGFSVYFIFLFHERMFAEPVLMRPQASMTFSGICT